ncbi:MAG: superoxide dismutase [Bacteroidetes bacterium]|nr:superoxide dismutase [Bacteroidota bacterium]
MKILAIEIEKSSVPQDKRDELLFQEAASVWELKTRDIIREIYFTHDHRAVIILECNNREEAEAILASLPLVEQNHIDFELMELNPYTGFGRLFRKDG